MPRSLVEALGVRSDGYDPGRSALEARVLEAIARAGLPSPQRQWRFERANGRDAFIDLAYPDAHLAIELDGWAEHGLRSAFDADRARGNELVLAGWRLLRFTWTMTDDEIVAAITAALA
jgi:very-short-patch-repair endonuclease